MLKQDKRGRKEGMRSIPWLSSALHLAAAPIDFLSLLLHEQVVSSLHKKKASLQKLLTQRIVIYRTSERERK